ncbi:hypothetical protein GCM10009765_67300 [Fodinicola feengrottensis]|uniref:Uncharacterized protein n=1 Tax=Fodinicola feengrottensis TaxID=435914 RepID=A0ABP4UMH6_9ACTN
MSSPYRRRSSTGLIIAIVCGALAVLLCCGGGLLVAVYFNATNANKTTVLYTATGSGPIHGTYIEANGSVTSYSGSTAWTRTISASTTLVTVTVTNLDPSNTTPVTCSILVNGSKVSDQTGPAAYCTATLHKS